MPMETDPLVTLTQVLRWLPWYIVIDFTCPGIGPHDWTSASIPHVRNQYCRNCDAKKQIPGSRRELPRHWSMYTR